MKYFEEAVALVCYTDEQIVEIEQLFNETIRGNDLSPALLVKIKNLLENLRSALDYCAHGLCARYGSKIKKETYFPYASMTTTREQFSARLEEKIPGLRNNRPDLAKFIESMQPFSREGDEWFPQFMRLTNDNKHVRLTPRKRMNGVTLKVGSLVLSSERIDFGSTGRFVTDEGEVLPGQEIRPGVPIKTSGTLNARAEEWDTFFLDGVSTHMDALEFIKYAQRALSNVVKILAKA